MQLNLCRYTTHLYDGLKTSPAILCAIERIASGLVLDRTSDAYRVWWDPTDAEFKRVCTLAWRLADAEADVLHWGVERIRRSSDREG